MASMLALLALLMAAALPSEAAESAMHGAANPIRKVVTLLQAMQKKVEEEGGKEKELFDKFMCYCQTGGKDLAASIATAEAKAPSLGSEGEAAEGKLEQAKADLKEAQADRTAAEEAMAQATALREKEAAAFAAEKADYDANIAAVAKAVAALEKGAAGSFLQTPAAHVLRLMADNDNADVSDADRTTLVAFLSQSADYAPSSGEITGILKQIGDTMAQAVADATATEEAALKTYEGLMAAKTAEKEVVTATVEAKTQQIGELGVAIVQMKEDLADTQATLAEDKKFLAELAKSCATKGSEWDARSKTRAEELVALADTIKILNDDEALDLFKKTLPNPSASFLEIKLSMSALRARALAAVHAARQSATGRDRAGLDLLALALAGKKTLTQGGFDKVISMIDEMVALLKKEQLDDEAKKGYCGQQFDLSDDKKKELDRAVSDLGTAIATTEEGIKTLAHEIGELEAGIKALDLSVAEATEQRKAENAEYKDLMASDTAAKELLAFAKNRLNQFYNPKLYKAPPKRELSTGDRVYEKMGGEIPTTPPSGIAGTGVAVLVQVSAHAQRKASPGPPPETFGAYASKTEEGTGVIAMIDILSRDLDKELTVAEAEEKEGQADYEELMADAAEKRATDSQSLTVKGATKADMEAELEASKASKAAATAELMATLEYIQSLHAECDWLLQYFDTRKEARTGEVDSLKKAKDVLSGADVSLVQTRARRSLRRSA